MRKKPQRSPREEHLDLWDSSVAEPILCQVPWCTCKMYPTRVAARFGRCLTVITAAETMFGDREATGPGVSFVIHFRCEKGHASTLAQVYSRVGATMDFDYGPCPWDDEPTTPPASSPT